MEQKRLEWMTGKRKYDATFAEFAAANELNYDLITDPVESFDVVDELFLDLHNITRFYEPNRTGIDRVYKTTTGLRHHPAILNKIARVTVLPKSGYKEKFTGWAPNFVQHVMDEEKMDVVNLIMWQIKDKKINFEINLYFAPYIMSLILSKTKFKGPCDVSHDPYRPFKNDRTFLERELTPYLPGDANEALGNPEQAAPMENAQQDAPEEGAPEGAGGAQAMPPPPPPPQQSQWVPPEGYFDPYFASMQQSIDTQFQQIQTRFDSHFEAYGQQMNTNLQNMQQGFEQQLETRFRAFEQNFHNNMYVPMMDRLQNVSNSINADISALNERFDGLTTFDDHERLANKQKQLQDDFDAFRDHFYSYFPAPVPPHEFLPHPPYLPPPPPQDD